MRSTTQLIGGPMKAKYLNIISSIERTHRLFLEAIDIELDKLNIEDINSTQALLIYNIGSKTLPIGEITARGYYIGTNVSYNLRKIIAAGYAEQSTSKHDKRSSVINLSKKGLQLQKSLDSAINSHATLLKKEQVDVATLLDLISTIEVFLGRFALRKNATVRMDNGE